MRRRIFRVIAAVSGVLCLAMAALWVRSLWHFDSISYETGINGDLRQYSVRIWSEGGVFGCQHMRAQHDRFLARRGRGDGIRASSGPNDNNYMLRAMRKEGIEWRGFGYAYDEIFPIDGGLGTREKYVTLMAPHWAAVILTGVMPAAWALAAWRRWRVRRRGENLCTCGYDLRATPWRCPECGREQVTETLHESLPA